MISADIAKNLSEKYKAKDFNLEERISAHISYNAMIMGWNTIRVVVDKDYADDFINEKLLPNGYKVTKDETEKYGGTLLVIEW